MRFKSKQKMQSLLELLTNKILSHGEIMDIIVETKDGVVIQIGRGATHIMDDEQEITYEQMMIWLIEGSLKQHGFSPYKGIASKSCNSNSSHAIRNTRNLLTTAAIIAAI